MRTLLKNHSFPVQIEGFPYILAGLLLVLSTSVLWRTSRSAELLQEAPNLPFWTVLTAAVLFSAFTLFSIWFYRNPNRNTPQNEPRTVFSPADGRVLKVETVDGKRIGQPTALKISIFMSPMDVHVNRSPIAGKIELVQYNKGAFFKADLDKASEENEHAWYVVKSATENFKIAFVQIAGFVARRIVTYVTPGENLTAGERFGMIRFGSRMEIVVPVGSKILVQPGDRTLAGLTKLASVTP